MKKTIILSLGLSLLAPASFAQEPAKFGAASIEAPLQTSRLRMFGQNGAMAVLFKNSACVKSIWSDEAEKVSGGLASAFSSFVGKASNLSLGIAETDNTRNLSKKDGIFSKAYFREYVIPAEKPSSMRMGFQDVSSFYVGNGIHYNSVNPSCRGAISFTPVAGADYEAAFAWEGKECRLSVNQVLSVEGKSELVPVPVVPAPDC
ncbi:hypothetical protein AAKU55_001220 [Oxalobacteraceae bacterium GrIS 1.11]